MKTLRVYLPYIALALVCVQYPLHISAVSDFIYVPQPVWLVLNTLQIAVMMVASVLLRQRHPPIAYMVSGFAMLLAGATISENFIRPLGPDTWVLLGGVLVVGLMLSAVYLLKNEEK